MKYLQILILLLSLFSCQQKPDTEKIKQFAQTLHTYTGFQTKATQQAFVNKMTETFNIVKENNNAKIDTKELRDLLEKAKQANQTSFNEINNIQEVDNEINLKEKTLNTIELFRSLYQNEFSKTIEILESKESNKIEKAGQLFTGKEDEVNKVQTIAKEADEEFTNKYNISFPKDSTK